MKYFFIFLFFIIVIVLYFKNKNYEIMYNTNDYNKYKKKLNKVNVSVRENNFNIYPLKKNFNDWIIKEIKNILKNKKIILKKNIYYSEYGVEFNYPHTINNKIVLSYDIFKDLNKIYKNNDITTLLHKYGSLIIHESVHIEQRYNYNFFVKLYEKWGFIHVNKIENIEKLLEIKRTNPDAMNDDNILWKNNNKYYFVNSFFNKNNLNKNNVEYKAYIIKKYKNKYIYNEDDSKNYILLKDFNEFINFFGSISNNYTPNEICAEYYEKLYLENLKNITFNSPGYKLFKLYLNSK